MQFADFSYSFFMKSFSIGSFMEIEIAAEYFIRTFTREHHLYSHRLYYPCKQVHWRGCPDRRNIVCFNVINDLPDCIEHFLNCKINFMMYCSDAVSYTHLTLP